MLDAHTLATAWLLRHTRGLSRSDALARCTAYLVDAQEISQDTAGRIALQALAELESFNQRARIDTVATTAHVVVVHRPDGAPLAFTVSDLMRLHQTAQRAQPTPRTH